MLRKILDETDYNVALDPSPAVVTTKPASDGSSGLAVLPVAMNQTLLLAFGVDADGKTASYSVRAVVPIADDSGRIVAWMKKVIAAGDLTGGAQQYETATFGTSTYVWVDTISEASGPGGNRSPWAREFSVADDHIGLLEVDCRHADLIEVQVTRNGKTAAGIDVFMGVSPIAFIPDLTLRS